MSDIKISVSTRLKYTTAIVDSVFLNNFINSIRNELEIRSILISDEIAKMRGSDINELLDRVTQDQMD